MEKLALMIRISILAALFYYLLPYFLPFIFAVIVVVLFEPTVTFLESKWKIKRFYSVISTYTLSFLLFFTCLYFLVFRIFKEVVAFIKGLPSFIENLYVENTELSNLYAKLPLEYQHHVSESLSAFAQRAAEHFSGLAGGFLTYVASFSEVFIGFIVFMVSVYLMGFTAPSLKPTFLSFFANGTAKKGAEILLEKLHKAIIGFIRAQFILSLVVFLITWAGISMIGLPYASISALIVVLIDLLPILGTGAAIFPWALYLYVTGDLSSALSLVCLFIILTVVRRTLEPKLLADTLGISALASLISMYVGLCLMGIVGMILGPALVIVLKSLHEAHLINLKIKAKP